MPALAATVASLLHLGSTFTVQLTNLPPSPLATRPFLSVD